MGEKEEKIIEEMNQKLEDTQEADGFFIIINARRGKKLSHFYAAIKFNADDQLQSLSEIENMIEKRSPKTSTKIVKFKPRTYK